MSRSSLVILKYLLTGWSGTSLTATEKTLFTRWVPINLLVYRKYAKPNKNRFALAFALQFGEVAASKVIIRLGERNVQFS